MLIPPQQIGLGTRSEDAVAVKLANKESHEAGWINWHSENRFSSGRDASILLQIRWLFTCDS